MAGNAQSWIGRGVYSFSEASRLLQVDAQKVSRWAVGKSTGRGFLEPALTTRVGELDERPTLSFLDLVELLFVKGFRARKLSLPYIRRAADEAARLLNSDHPFAVERFQTDGSRIFATMTEKDERMLQLGSGGQMVIERVIRQYLEDLEYDIETGMAMRWWPCGKKGRVFVDPKVSFGAPVTAGGVPTETLYLAYESNGRSAKAVADFYEIGIHDVRASVRFEHAIAKAKRAA